MTTRVAGFVNSLRSFIIGPGRPVLFICLFYATWLVQSCFSARDFDLDSFPGRMIGIATLEGYDISARVSLFYRCVAVFFTSLPAFLLIAFFIHRKYPSAFTVEIKIINYASLAGLLLFLFFLFRSDITDTLEIIYFIHKLMITGILLRLIFFKKIHLSINHYTIIVVLTISLYFFIADCVNLFGYFRNPDFYIVTFITACLLLIAVNLVYKTGNGAVILGKISFILVPLTLLPCLSVLKDELFLVLKANRVILQGQTFIYLLLIAGLVASMAIRYKKVNRDPLKPEKDLIALRYFPLLIFSLVTYACYNVFINFKPEFFEAGNKYLPVMEFNLFGVIPTLEKFNSHLVSDYFFTAVYSFLNGLNIHEAELYDFLLQPVSFILYYYLIYFLSRNAFVAVFAVLIFPYSRELMPEPYSLSLLVILSLNKVLSTPSLKSYLLYFTLCALLVAWRIDLGYPCLVVMPLLLLFYHFFSPDFKINWPLLLKSSLIVIGTTFLIIVSLSLYRHVNLFSKLQYTLNYFTSAQTYGLTTLGDDNSALYKMHYFVFPLIVTFILIALIISFRSLNRSKHQRLAYLSLFFLCAFYLLNFNRGLVRHSIIEGFSYFTGSFIYIILPGSLYVFFRGWPNILKFGALVFISFFAIITYHLPEAMGSRSLLDASLVKVRTAENIDLGRVKSRVKNVPPDAQKKFKPFIEFINKNTGPEETFIDFDNRPMLYFYTQKQSPSFFYQNPACSHNEFLQKKFIEDLQEYNAPYIYFSEMGWWGYDHLDDVPNTFRHYRMSEYFYRNYSPYIIVGEIRVWKKNTAPDHNKKDTIYTFKKRSDSLTVAGKIKVSLKIKTGKKYLLKMTRDAGKQVGLDVTSGSAVRTLYNMTDTLDYCTLEPSADLSPLGLVLSGPVNEFQIIECDHIPDFHEDRYLFYYLKKLPHIWGSYDKEVLKEQVLFEHAVPFPLENKDHKLNVPETLDKETGNTLIITCRNTGKKTHNVVLYFGDKKSKNRTALYFDVVPSPKEEKYAIRISSVYKWMKDPVNQISLVTTGASNKVTVLKIQITKGL